MISRLALPLVVVFALACNRDKEAGADAAPEAAAPDVVADAAPEVAAPAANVSATPLPTAPVVVKTAAKPAAPAPDPPICVAARAARARSSPTTTNLEAQCKAAGGKP